MLEAPRLRMTAFPHGFAASVLNHGLSFCLGCGLGPQKPIVQLCCLSHGEMALLAGLLCMVVRYRGSLLFFIFRALLHLTHGLAEEASTRSAMSLSDKLERLSHKTLSPVTRPQSCTAPRTERLMRLLTTTIY